MVWRISYCFNAMDVCSRPHINYARWLLTIHFRDMTTPQTSHPRVYEKFAPGAFAVRKSTRVFSAIAMDHAQEEENASIKGEGSTFLKNFKNLVNVIEELGTPFKEDGGELLAVDTKEVMP